MLGHKLLSGNGAVMFKCQWQIAILRPLRVVQSRAASKASFQLAPHQVSVCKLCKFTDI